jgi:hypothetical protein
VTIIEPTIPALCRRYLTRWYYKGHGGTIGVRWLVHIVWFKWSPYLGAWEPFDHSWSRRGATKHRVDGA